tara:strand:+ start:815 stop:1042 length:228 start_codon:yes stop_codon:yes gene_type:complete
MQNGNGKSNIIELSDILEQKLRKERELSFYEGQLAQLLLRMQTIRKEIEITNMIIELVSDENIIDIQDYIKSKEH